MNSRCVHIILDPGFLDLLLPHVQNATSLSVISFFTLEEPVQALPDFPKSMPNLRSLTLHIPEQAEWSPLNDSFDFSTHMLRVLSLYNIPLFPSILGLKTLTELTLFDDNFNLHLDTLLDLLEENHSLESATLGINFAGASLRRSQRKNPIGNQLRYLSICCDYAMDIRALISSIALRKGANLKIYYGDHYNDEGDGLTDILSGVSLTHLPSLSSPTFMEYRSSPRIIRLLGPGGSFSYESNFSLGIVFREFTVLSLDSIREFRLKYHASVPRELYLTSFPSLEVLAIGTSTCESTLSIVLPDPASSSLKTLAFLNFHATEDFMAGLTQFASDRENTTSASLNRVVILNQSNKRLPTLASIERLRKHVPVVEVMEGMEFPKDLL